MVFDSGYSLDVHLGVCYCDVDCSDTLDVYLITKYPHYLHCLLLFQTNYAWMYSAALIVFCL